MIENPMEFVFSWYQQNETILACERNGLKFVTPSYQDKYIARDIFFTGNVDPMGQLVFFALAELYHGKSPGVLLDIGANIGTTAIHALQRDDVTHVYAFEPHPLNFACLRANLCLNNLDHKVTAINAAVGNVTSKMELAVSNINCGDNRISFPTDKLEVNEQNEDSMSTITVDVITLDEYFKEKEDRDNIRYMWVDTQGFEYFVLSGAESIISSNTSIVIEFWPYQMVRNNSLDECVQYIRKTFTHFVIMEDLTTPPALKFNRLRSRPIPIDDICLLCEDMLNYSIKTNFNNLFLLRL